LIDTRLFVAFALCLLLGCELRDSYSLFLFTQSLFQRPLGLLALILPLIEEKGEGFSNGKKKDQDKMDFWKKK